MVEDSIVKLEKELKHLVLEARKGDMRSYNGLLKAALPFVRRNTAAQMSRFGYSQLSEDVVQEILIALHLKLHTYDETRPFLAWLRAVMKNKMIDALRRQKTNMVSINENEFLEPQSTDGAEASTVQNDLQYLLDKLKPPAGEIIYNMKVEGMSVKELAKKYNLSESNVKVMVHRGLQKLSAMVKGEDNVYKYR